MEESSVNDSSKLSPDVIIKVLYNRVEGDRSSLDILNRLDISQLAELFDPRVIAELKRSNKLVHYLCALLAGSTSQGSEAASQRRYQCFRTSIDLIVEGNSSIV